MHITVTICHPLCCPFNALQQIVALILIKCPYFKTTFSLYACICILLTMFFCFFFNLCNWKKDLTSPTWSFIISPQLKSAFEHNSEPCVVVILQKSMPHPSQISQIWATSPHFHHMAAAAFPATFVSFVGRSAIKLISETVVLGGNLYLIFLRLLVWTVFKHLICKSSALPFKHGHLNTVYTQLRVELFTAPLSSSVCIMGFISEIVTQSN